MAYIGNAPGSIRQGRRAVYEFTSTANQTAFSGTDENGLTLDLLQANDNDVYLNGVRLIITDDYTISGDVLTLVSGAAAGDKLIIMTQDEIANDASYSKAASDSRYINYDGDIVNGTIQIGGSGNNITFADNNKAVFGDDSDLQIYHDGDNSYIRDTGTGNLNISGDEVRILNAGNNELKALFTTDGAVELYHDNSQRKLATTSTGIDVTGIVTASGNITAGSSTAGVVTVGSANGFEIQKSGVNGYINQSDSGPIIIRMGSSYSEKIRIDSSGNVGIGTSTPARPLNIVNDAGSNPIQSIRNSSVAWSQYALTRYGTEGEDVRYMDFGYYRGSNEPTRGLVIKSQANATLVTFLDSGNVGIGTSSPAHKLDVAGTTKADQYLLDAVAKDISDTAVDVFIYDTRKDSDGGAWRKRTQHTSWYNETLNTATRGARKEFPAVAVIVAESNQVTIYDGDDPDMPMWMVFETGANTIPWTSTVANVYFLNGLFCIGCDGREVESNFISEAVTLRDATYWYEYLINIKGRNDVPGNTPILSTTKNIINSTVNDVAMTVLPNAPIDAATGLPVPTIAVATNGGVSIIKGDGTVVDITHSSGVKRVVLDGKNNLVGACLYLNLSPTDGFYVYDIPSADIASSSYKYKYESNLTIPALTGRGGANAGFHYGVVSTLNGFAGANYYQPGGNEHPSLVLLDTSTTEQATHMANYITSDYNTGWMNGDIKLATLSDTDDTNVTGSELVTNGTFDSGVSGWTEQAGGGASIAVVSGELQITGGTTSYPRARQEFTTVVGQKYVVSATARRGTTSSNVYIYNNDLGASNITYYSGTTNAELSFTFTASSTTSYVELTIDGISNGTTAFFDNVSVRLAEEDRSVNGNGLQVFGTVTKTAVATGADLVGYGPFSSANYLQQPYNSDLAYGTGDFCYTLWSKKTATAHGYIFDRSNGDGSQRVTMYYNANNTISAYTNNGPINDIDIPLNSWFHIVLLRVGGMMKVYINGVFMGENSTTTNLSGDTNAGLRLGTRFNGTDALVDGYLSLFRSSATVPSPEQIAKIYEDEKFLFQENAKATLYGSSEVVKALAYDDDTQLLHAGTSAGRSVFQGLRRIDNTTDAVDTAISVSNGMVVED